jgi:hypothetical protein
MSSEEVQLLPSDESSDSSRVMGVVVSPRAFLVGDNLLVPLVEEEEFSL